MGLKGGGMKMIVHVWIGLRREFWLGLTLCLTLVADVAGRLLILTDLEGY